MQKLLLLTALLLTSPIMHAMDAQAQTTQQSSIKSLDDDDVHGERTANREAFEVERKEGVETREEDIIQQFKSAYITFVVPSLLKAGTINEATAQKMITDGGATPLICIEDNYHTIRDKQPDKTSSFKEFLQEILDFLPNYRPTPSKNIEIYQKEYSEDNAKAVAINNEEEQP